MKKWILKTTMTLAATTLLANTQTNSLVKVTTPKTDWTKEQFIANQKIKWEQNGWRWNQEKVEAMFTKMDVNKDGIVTGLERKAYWNKVMQQKSK